MGYTNSPLVNVTVLSPNHSGLRTKKIKRITPHVIVGQCTAERIGELFINPSREASCNYGIGKDGRVCLVVEEKNCSWCSSSSANDQQAVTIECSSDSTHPYAINDTVYNKLIELCADICKRNGATKLLWISDKDIALNYVPKDDEMLITVHRWFKNKACPGEYIYSRLDKIAAEVTKRLAVVEPTKPATPSTEIKQYYRVRKTWEDASSQLGAFFELENAKKACIDGYKVFDWNGKVVYPVETPKAEATPVPTTFTPYMVKIDVSEISDHCLNIREKPDAGSKKVGVIEQDMSLTIVDEVKSENGNIWGLLKAGEKYRNRWINLYYTKR